jgi:hypothetical protein
MKKLRPAILTVLVLVVYALHQDFWNWKRVEPLVLGFLPVGLAYHAGYSLMVALLMWALVKWAWPADLDHTESRPGENAETKEPKA